MIELYEGNGKYIKLDNIYDIFVSVKDFGAFGDGFRDDTNAIQKAINSIKYIGGTVYFPHGTYNVTSPIFIYNNQTIMGDRATLFQGTEYDNIMRNYNTGINNNGIARYDATKNITIKGITFDGANRDMDATLLGIEHAENIVIDDCRFRRGSGYLHDIHLCSCKNVIIKNCQFLDHNRASENSCRIRINNYDNESSWTWQDGVADKTLSWNIDIHNCYFTGWHGMPPAIGNHDDVAVNYVRIHDNMFADFLNERGTIRFKTIDNLDVYNNIFDNCKTGVNDMYATIRNNRFVSCKNPYNDNAIHYNNIINGTLTQ